MSDYLVEIERAYSEARGIQSLLSPVNWNLASDWEKRGIPLRIVLGAIEDVAKRFNTEDREDRINSLKYFKQAVEHEFAVWKKGQVGRSDNGSPNEANADPVRAAVNDPIISTLLELQESYEAALKDAGHPELLKSAIRETIENLEKHREDFRTGRTSVDELESKLLRMRVRIELAMVSVTSAERREDIVRSVEQDFKDVMITEQARNKLCNKRLHRNHGLPVLTLWDL